MTIGEAEIKIATDIQVIYDQDEARAIARAVLSHVCKISLPQLIIKRYDLLYKTEERAVRLIRDELVNGKPLQYILGESIFYGFRFKVTPAVLIPRPETEELVEWVFQECMSRELEQITRVDECAPAGKERILDIGTGSGCIPVTLKKLLPEADVSGLDVSREALQIARKNAALNDADVRFVRLDILNYKGKLTNIEPLTVIVSNPPYITEAEKEQMHLNVLDYEPHSALFVPDTDPLRFYKAIAGFALLHLADGGLLFFEVNERYGVEVVELLQSAGFSHCTLRKDLQGKDRMIRAVR